MNYLAHLYLAEITNTSLIGNFLGDFVRGKVEDSGLLSDYEEGIRLHRKIDLFTDSHDIVANSRNRISSSRRRFAGIIIDMAYDHFLAKNWQSYSDKSLNEFVQSFHSELQSNRQHLPANSLKIIPYLIQGNWLENYQTISGIEYGLNGIGRRFENRSGRKNTLHGSVNEIQSNFKELEADFNQFFPQVIDYVKEFSGN